MVMHDYKDAKWPKSLIIMMWNVTFQVLIGRSQQLLLSVNAMYFFFDDDDFYDSEFACIYQSLTKEVHTGEKKQLIPGKNIRSNISTGSSSKSTMVSRLLWFFGSFRHFVSQMLSLLRAKISLT